MFQCAMGWDCHRSSSEEAYWGVGHLEMSMSQPASSILHLANLQGQHRSAGDPATKSATRLLFRHPQQQHRQHSAQRSFLYPFDLFGPPSFLALNVMSKRHACSGVAVPQFDT